MFLIGLISVASLICGFTIHKEGSSTANIPTDFTGTYCAYSAGSVFNLTLNPSEAEMTFSGNNGLREDVNTVTYEYQDESAMESRFGLNSSGLVGKLSDNTYYVFTINVDNPQRVTYWASTSSPVSLTKGSMTFKEAMNDPGTYYGTYRYNASNYLTISKGTNDDTCLLYMNGSRMSNYINCIYVTQGWMTRVIGISYGRPMIVCYYLTDDDRVYYILFQYIDSSTLLYDGDYYWNKV